MKDVGVPAQRIGMIQHMCRLKAKPQLLYIRWQFTFKLSLLIFHVVTAW